MHEAAWSGKWTHIFIVIVKESNFSKGGGSD